MSWFFFLFWWHCWCLPSSFSSLSIVIIIFYCIQDCQRQTTKCFVARSTRQCNCDHDKYSWAWAQVSFAFMYLSSYIYFCIVVSSSKCTLFKAIQSVIQQPLTGYLSALGTRGPGGSKSVARKIHKQRVKIQQCKFLTRSTSEVGVGSSSGGYWSSCLGGSEDSQMLCNPRRKGISSRSRMDWRADPWHPEISGAVEGVGFGPAGGRPRWSWVSAGACLPNSPVLDQGLRALFCGHWGGGLFQAIGHHDHLNFSKAVLVV